jgi:hypothetical protein
MQIHELTKGPQRTDEGVLDGIKGAIKQAATSVYKNKIQAPIKNKINSVGQGIKRAGQEYTGTKMAADANGPNNPFLTKMAGIKNAYNNWGDQAQSNQQNKTQNKINKDAEKSAAILARKGYNVNGQNQNQTLKPAPAGTPSNIKAQAQAMSQLKSNFINTFVGPQQGNNTPTPTTMANAPASVTNKANPNNPNFKGVPPVANTMANAPVGRTNTAKPGNPNITTPPPAATNMASAPVSKTNTAKPGNPNLPAPTPKRTGGRVAGAPLSQTPNAIRKRAARLKEDGEFLTELKSIQDFPTWIDSQIPGLVRAKQDPDVKAKLDQAFSALSAAKNNPDALSKAFDNYVAIANQAMTQGTQQGTQQGASSSGVPPSQQDRMNANLTKLIPPDTAKQLQQQIRRKELTPDALIHYLENPTGY